MLTYKTLYLGSRCFYLMQKILKLNLRIVLLLESADKLLKILLTVFLGLSSLQKITILEK